jgi:hypothetical protein
MLEDLLRLHPLERSWLDEIVDIAVSRAEGEVTVAVLVQALAPPGARTSVERTVRQCLDDFSSGLDGGLRPDWDLFYQIDAQRYRLRSHPVRPDLLDHVDIRFREPAVQDAFESFAEMIESQQPKLWAAADIRRRLDAFGRVLANSAIVQEPLPLANPRAMRKAGWRRPGPGRAIHRL